MLVFILTLNYFMSAGGKQENKPVKSEIKI